MNEQDPEAGTGPVRYRTTGVDPAVDPAEDRVSPLRRKDTWAGVFAVLLGAGLLGAVGAAVWASAPPQSTAGARPGGAADGFVIADSFDSAASGWTSDTTADAAMGYTAGSYRIIVRRADYQQHSYVEFIEPHSGLNVEVTGRVVEGRPADGFGLGCWVGESGYYGGVFGDGFFAIFKAADAADRGANLEEGTRPRVRRSVAGGESRLRLACVPEGTNRVRIELWLDGTRIAQTLDEEPLGEFTGVGLFAASSSGKTEARFDDFLVEEASPGAVT